MLHVPEARSPDLRRNLPSRNWSSFTVHSAVFGSRQRFDNDRISDAWRKADELAQAGLTAKAVEKQRTLTGQAIVSREPVVIFHHSTDNETFWAEEASWADLADLAEWLYPKAAFIASGQIADAELHVLQERMRTVHARRRATPGDAAALGAALRSGLTPRVGQHLPADGTANTYAVLAALEIAGNTRRTHAGIRGLRVCDLCRRVFESPWKERCNPCRHDRPLREAERSGDAEQLARAEWRIFARAEQHILAEVEPNVTTITFTKTGFVIRTRRARRMLGPQGTCAECGADFTPSRASHQFCTDACRQRSSRRIPAPGS